MGCGSEPSPRAHAPLRQHACSELDDAKQMPCGTAHTACSTTGPDPSPNLWRGTRDAKARCTAWTVLMFHTSLLGSTTTTQAALRQYYDTSCSRAVEGNGNIAEVVPPVRTGEKDAAVRHTCARGECQAPTPSTRHIPKTGANRTHYQPVPIKMPKRHKCTS